MTIYFELKFVKIKNNFLEPTQIPSGTKFSLWLKKSIQNHEFATNNEFKWNDWVQI